jgi:hypothetical protein
MPRSGPGPVTRWPLTTISPSVGSFRPAVRYSRLDLPQPEGPTMTANCWSGTSRETLSSATKVPPAG